MHELRLALRPLRQTPGFTVAAVLTLALALGANSVVFSAVRGMLIRPLPFPAADRLVWMYGRSEGGEVVRDQLASEEVRSLVDRTKALSDC